MSYYEIKCDQGSPEWHRARLGHLSASKALVLMEGSSAARNELMNSLDADLLRGESINSLAYVKAIQWGVAHEAEARSFYSCEVRQMKECGFFIHTSLPLIGCSPDGVFCASELPGVVSGGLEIKCPYNQEVHEQNRNGKELDRNYYWQIHFALWLFRCEWWDFMSYDPRQTGDKKVHVRRVFRSENVIKLISEQVVAWCNHRANGTRYESAPTAKEMLAAGLLPKFF